MRSKVAKRILQVFARYVLLAVLLFASVGRLDWPWAWAYLGVGLAALIANALALPPELMVERTGFGKKARDWDKVLLVLISGPVLVGLVVAGLDERWGWRPDVAPFAQVAGLVFLAMGQGLQTWAMATNTFFSEAIYIQKERGHTVVTGGPYRYVRHPGYVGIMISMLAMPIALGSPWALIPVGIGVGFYVVRTAMEDKMLLAELEGYTGYAHRVRFRLLPGLW
jgi:protein-S-isoprenylcysteine O-methyltransferase Ste14